MQRVCLSDEIAWLQENAISREDCHILQLRYLCNGKRQLSQSWSTIVLGPLQWGMGQEGRGGRGQHIWSKLTEWISFYSDDFTLARQWVCKRENVRWSRRWGDKNWGKWPRSRSCEWAQWWSKLQLRQCLVGRCIGDLILQTATPPKKLHNYRYR